MQRLLPRNKVLLNNTAMFKQITDLSGNEWYLIASLWIFLGFFIIVAISLFRMKKEHVDHMREIPLEEDEQNEPVTEQHKS